jgi:hypothetical protein
MKTLLLVGTTVVALAAANLAPAMALPSLKGTTAFDRLPGAMKGWPPEDAAAMTLLRRSRLRLSRLSGDRFEDLATGETLRLLPTPPSDAVGDNVAFGRFTTTEDGIHPCDQNAGSARCRHPEPNPCPLF